MTTDRDDQLAIIVEQLRQLIQQSSSDTAKQAQSAADAASALSPVEMVELIVGAREVRNRHIGTKMFGEPAWDMLLSMYIAHSRGRAYSISSASTLGETPPTTGLRWLAVLEDHGMVMKRRDENDGRRIYVDLTPEAVEHMESFVEAFAAWVGTRASLRRL